MKNHQEMIDEAVKRQKDKGRMTCEEASIHSRETYIPCGRPAESFVLSERGQVVYAMCGGCATHNLHNRGAENLGPVKCAR